MPHPADPPHRRGDARLARRSLLALAAALAIALGGCGAASGDDPLVVFAAASLEEAMEEIAAVWEAAGGAEVALNTAGSNVLAQQIRAGAAADLFLSADARWADRLADEGRLEPGTRRAILTNRLVVIAHPDAGFSLARLEDLPALAFEHLSLADPRAVPAGRYARSVLESAPAGEGSLWTAVADRVAPAPDVRAALALVAAERTAVGIVYASDVVAERGVEILHVIEREPDPPIRYVAALVRREPAPREEAAALLRFLSSDEARAIFERHGFTALEPSASLLPRLPHE